MKDRAAYQAAAGQQSAESSGTAAVPPFVETEKPRAKARAAAAVPGLTFPRFFTEADVDPFDEIEWEIRAAAIQFVRKLSGATRPSRANEAVFERAIDAVTEAATLLVRELETNAPPRNREIEAAKALERAAERYGRPAAAL